METTGIATRQQETESPRRETSSKIAFSWLLLLRWGAVACQALLICIVYLFFSMQVPLLIVSVVIAFEGFSNLFFFYLQKRQAVIPERLFAIVMFLDVILLTCLLYYTGGPMNPFTFLYLVHIVLGAILMRPTPAWFLTVFTISCYAGFFFLPGGGVTTLSDAGQDRPVCIDTINSPFSEDHLRMHLQGMWVAFSITAFFIVFFVGKIQQALETHQETINRLKEDKLRNEKLASLATLAAGAAHEFATPLSTIAVAAGEMVHNLQDLSGDPELIDDARLIREQVARCKEILFQMAADAGEHLGEPVVLVRIGELVEEMLSMLMHEYSREVRFINDAADYSFRVPLRSFRRTLRGLLKNAFDATPDNSEVTLTCRRDENFLYFEVEDSGVGMDAETLAKATEPFFTTKEPGKGLGLGLFLAKSMAERFGGTLGFVSEPDKGTRATLSLALARIE